MQEEDESSAQKSKNEEWQKEDTNEGETHNSVQNARDRNEDEEWQKDEGVKNLQKMQ